MEKKNQDWIGAKPDLLTKELMLVHSLKK